MSGRLERGGDRIRIAYLPVERFVAGDARMKLRRVHGPGRDHVGDCRQIVVVDVNALGGIPGRLQ